MPSEGHDFPHLNLKKEDFHYPTISGGLGSAEGFNGTRGLPEPLTVLINGPEDIQMLPNNRWAIDATKPSLAEPLRRSEFVRLQARGEGVVKLADFC